MRKAIPNISRRPLEIADPVRFPALPAIDRKSLLPARRDGGDPRPQNARLDRPPLEAVVADEGADPVLEPAANRRGDRRRAPAVQPPAQPLSSEERLVGKEWVSTCSSRRLPHL